MVTFHVIFVTSHSSNFFVFQKYFNLTTDLGIIVNQTFLSCIRFEPTSYPTFQHIGRGGPSCQLVEVILIPVALISTGCEIKAAESYHPAHRGPLPFELPQ